MDSCLWSRIQELALHHKRHCPQRAGREDWLILEILLLMVTQRKVGHAESCLRLGLRQSLLAFQN